MIGQIKERKQRIDERKNALEEAGRRGDYTLAAQIKNGELPTLEKELLDAEKRLTDLHAKGGGLLRDEVTAEEIADVVSKWTGIPVTRMLEGEREKLIKMDDRLHDRVVGQDKAVRAVSDAVRRSRAGLGDPNRPIGSFLFLGPTGVGKTELCKAVAAFLFDDESAFIRIDMSEFMEPHSVARLIGAPPGYVGYEEGGRLTEAVHRKPYAVILLDEIEKAHPDVFNVLLQVLDDGRLTDGHGRTVDFKNCIIAMTSNIGSQHIQQMLEVRPDMKGRSESVVGAEIESKVKEELKRHFRPEFLNRIDEIVIFHSLTREDLKRIVDIQLQQLQKRLAARAMTLTLTAQARARLAEIGFDPVYGARPLKRLIQQEIENPLARSILGGEFSEGDAISVEAGPEGFAFRHQAAPLQPA